MTTLYLAAAFTALPVGAMYALQGLGIVLVFRTTRVFNFAQAGIGIAAAYVAAVVAKALGGGYASGLLGAALGVLAAAGIAIFIEWSSVRRAKGGLQKTVVTLGWLLALQSFIIAIFTQQTTLLPARILPSDQISWLRIDAIKSGFGLDQVVTILVAVVVALGLALFLSRTAFGVSMRAVADDPEAARLLGLKVSRVLMTTWGLGGAVAGLAGVLIAPLLGRLDTFSLFVLTVQAIAAALVGGLSSLPLTLAGGLGLAVLQNLAGVAFPAQKPIIGSLVAFLVVLGGVLLRRRSGRADVSEGGLEPARVRPLPGPARSGTTVLGVGAVLGVLLLVTSNDGAGNLSLIAAWSLAALSVVLLTGVAGQVSVCQGVFMGIGAILASVATSHGVPFLAALVLGAIGAGLSAALVGIPALRLEPLELAVVTVAFAFAADGFLFQWGPATNNGDRPLPRPSWASASSLAGERWYAVFAVAVFVAMGFAVASLRRGRTGAALTALRSSEAATAAMGFSPTANKLKGFALSGAIAGLAGAILAGAGGGVSLGQVSSYDTTASITLLAYAIIAGVGNVPAAVLTGFLVVVPTVFGGGGTNEHVQGAINTVSGLFLVGVVILAPQGLASLLSRLRPPVITLPTAKVA
jgi:ABC-type branched-subunit amino acid transport system permease subunit